jgi:hypothetical protein
MPCEPFTHDSAPDPPNRADWRQSTTTCTRCGEVRNALTGRTQAEQERLDSSKETC